MMSKLRPQPDEIVWEYPTISFSDVQFALAYEYNHCDEGDLEIREGGEFAEMFRAGDPSIFDELGE